MEGGVQEATAPQRPEPVPHTEQRLLHPSAACVTEGPSCPPESAAKDGRRPALTTRTALRPPGPCPAPLSSAPPPALQGGGHRAVRLLDAPPPTQSAPRGRSPPRADHLPWRVLAPPPAALWGYRHRLPA